MCRPGDFLGVEMKYNLVTYQSDNKDNPGFFASKPLRGARGRGEDYLLLQIFPAEDSAYWQANLAKVAREATRAFYRSPGSITNAIRGAVEQVNTILRVQNSGLRLDKTPETATMMAGVLRDGVLYLGQAGHASALLVSGAGTQLFYDDTIEQRGLGLTDLFDVRFFRTDFFGADFLLFGLPQAMKVFEREAPSPTSVIRLVNETAELTSAFSLTKIGLGEGEVENRLLSLAMLLDETDPVVNESAQEPETESSVVEEVLEVSAEPEGPIEVPAQLALPINEMATPEEDHPECEEVGLEDQVETHEKAQEEDEPDINPSTVIIDLPVSEEAVPEALTEKPHETLLEDEDLAADGLVDIVSDYQEERLEAQKALDDFEDAEEEAEVGGDASFDEPEEQFFATDDKPADRTPIVEEVIQEPDAAAIARQERLQRLKQGALVGIARGAGWLRGVEEGAQQTARRAEQKASEVGQEIPSLSPFSKWMIVIIVPLIVVAIAVSIYFARGLDRQYAYFVTQAQYEIQSVNELSEPGQQRQALVQAIIWLNKAREFNQSDTAEIIQLRNQAQAGLDTMDGVQRIVFQNAFGKTVYPDLDISHLVPGQQAIFALDRHSGRVLRFYKVGDSYLPDNKFVCGPGTYGKIELGPIIDITDIPGSSPNNALVMGIDASGKVIYCSDSGKAQIVAQLQAPVGGLGSIDAIHFGNDGLYLLDATRSNIWVYRGLMDQFPDEPGSYLGDEEVDLTEAVDIVVRREGLYLLFADGRMAFSNVPYYDGFVEAIQQGPQPQAILGQFSQISGLPVADNRLYFLEATEPAIGRYSYRLVFNDVLKVSFGDQATPGRAVTALAVSSSQTAFLAYGGQLFYAQLP